MIAAVAIVDEPDDLEPQLAMFEDLVGDQASEVARAGDQDPLEADPRAPSPLERFAHELSREVNASATLMIRKSSQTSCDDLEDARVLELSAAGSTSVVPACP